MTPAGAGSGRPPGRRRPAARLGLALALAVAVLALSACDGGEGPGGDGGGTGTTAGGEGTGGDEPGPTFPTGPATSTVEVTLRDYAFAGIPAGVAGPNVLFEAKVRGSNAHELVLRDAAGADVDAIRPFRAGTTRRLAAVLPPGTYTAVCLVREGARTHADLGMRATFTVT